MEHWKKSYLQELKKVHEISVDENGFFNLLPHSAFKYSRETRQLYQHTSKMIKACFTISNMEKVFSNHF